MTRILLVEDDAKVASFIRRGLTENGYNVDIADNGLEAESMFRNHKYDLGIVDVLLPGQSGTDFCIKIRNAEINTPVLLLSALGTTDDKITGLESGADDYLTKPFEFKELLARVRALIRRKTEEIQTSIIKIANLEINLKEKSVKRDETSISLTAREFYLLEYLAKNKARVVSRVEIEERIWDLAFDRESNIVDVYINFLRKKIDRNYEPKLIHTVIGMGYMLKDKS